MTDKEGVLRKMEPKSLSERALKLVTDQPPWLQAWRELSNTTHALEMDDSRFPSIVALIERCDYAFLANDWNKFQQASEEIHHIVKKES